MSATESLSVTLERESGYRFTARFDGTELDPIVVDEPAPLGGGDGPNAARLLTVAVADCLSASLLFCLSKGGVEPRTVQTHGRAEFRRNPGGRLRIARIAVEIELSDAELSATRARRCLELFEEYCVVSASVRQGIPLEVRVLLDGELVHESRDAPADQTGIAG